MTTKAAPLLGLQHELLKAPERVPFGALHVDPNKFQSRSPEACNHVQKVLKKEAARTLTASLLEVVESGDQLDPLIVWEDPTGALWVVDGFHRYESLEEAGTKPRQKVWAQKFKGVTEAEARHFAFDVNKRMHLEMHPKERAEVCWRFLVSGETTGTVRERGTRYQVSKSQVHRMDQEAPAVLAQLRSRAQAAGVPCDTAFIREHMPAWKTLATWRDAPPADEQPDLRRKTVDRIVKSLALKHTDDAKVYLDEVLQAFEEFISEATGHPITISRSRVEDDEVEF
jgi:hypothetical protein